jgi:protein gp37
MKRRSQNPIPESRGRMMRQSRIEWTEATWNPVTGCTKISAGCANCYAEKMARRLQAMAQPNYRDGFRVTCHEHALELPLRWRKPQMIFVNSMSDLFHEDVPEPFIAKVFDVMRRANWHRFQVLTKREQRLRELAGRLPWPPNVMMGVSVENQACVRRIDALRGTPAKTKFLSVEPLLGPVGRLDLREIDWVIVGGESGIGARPMEEEWVLRIKQQCDAASIPFFFKQWGGMNKKKTGRILLGRTWDAVPLT